MSSVLLISLILSLASLSGGLLLLLWEKKINHYLAYLLSFSAGALLATVAGELLPTAFEVELDAHLAASCFLWGFLLLPLLSLFFPHGKSARLSGWLLLIADSIHNFIDGLAIAAAFLLGRQAGIILALGIFLHELPQEVSEFSLLYQRGFSRRQIIGLNLLSCLFTVLGVGVFYLLGSDKHHFRVGVASAMSAGYFFYLVASDLLPSLFQHRHLRDKLINLGIFLVSLTTIWLMITHLHHH